MPTKATPKSCNCRQCKYGKRTNAGHYLMKKEERAFRHNTKIELNKGKEDFAPAPHGDYIS